MKYQVIDDYDCDAEVIGYYNSEKEVKKAIQTRIDDTDGECYIIVGVLDSFGYYRPISINKFGYTNGYNK